MFKKYDDIDKAIERVKTSAVDEKTKQEQILMINELHALRLTYEVPGIRKGMTQTTQGMIQPDGSIKNLTGIYNADEVDELKVIELILRGKLTNDEVLIVHHGCVAQKFFDDQYVAQKSGKKTSKSESDTKADTKPSQPASKPVTPKSVTPPKSDSPTPSKPPQSAFAKKF